MKYKISSSDKRHSRAGRQYAEIGRVTRDKLSRSKTKSTVTFLFSKYIITTQNLYEANSSAALQDLRGWRGHYTHLILASASLAFIDLCLLFHHQQNPFKTPLDDFLSFLYACLV